MLSHWVEIAAIIILLVVQAYCELSLPSYTSGIINVGIQQGGIEDSVIKRISSAEMQKLLYFMEKDEAEAVTESYTLDSSGNYTLNDITNEQKEKLDDIFRIPMFLAYSMENTDKSSGMQIGSTTAMNADGTFNITEIKTKLSELDESILLQTDIIYIQKQYEAIGYDISQARDSYIMKSGIMMLIFAFIAMGSTILTTLLSARIGAAYGRDMRKSLFDKVMSFSSTEFNSLSTASLITRCTNDVQQVQMTTVMILRMVIYAPIVGVGAFIKVLQTGTDMSWVIGVGVVAVLSLVTSLFTVALPKFKIVQKLIDNLNRVSREILTGISVIRAFSSEKREQRRFDAANIDLTKLNTFLNRMMSIMFPSMMLIMNGISVLIIWVGAGAVDSGTMQVGDLTAFISYTMQIIISFLMLAMMSIMLPRAIISQKRIGEVLDTKLSIMSPEKPLAPDEEKRCTVEFKDVSFRYNGADEDVVSGISFTSAPGKTTAIIGSTGSGKSTIASLIPRFFDATGGEVLVNGVNVREQSLHTLRDSIGYVSQKAVLFSGTIASNISYSDGNMNDEQIQKAAEVAQALEFIDNNDEKYNYQISQGGTNVSGGQKQRLSIARAIAKNPDIYIFDDSFSALDYKTDIKLRKALYDYTKKSTVIIIAQRISTVINADQIIVLDEGRIAGKGTHRELMQHCEVYRQIALSQLSSEELGEKEEA